MLGEYVTFIVSAILPFQISNKAAVSQKRNKLPVPNKGPSVRYHEQINARALNRATTVLYMFSNPRE